MTRFKFKHWEWHNLLAVILAMWALAIVGIFFWMLITTVKPPDSSTLPVSHSGQYCLIKPDGTADYERCFIYGTR